jgi:hypothetical protein
LGAPCPALQNLRRLSQRRLFGAELLAEAEAHVGDRDEALRVMRPLERNYQDGYIVLTWATEIYALMDDEANASNWLGRT